MDLLSIVVALVVIGIILWVINTYIPMEATIKKILNVVVIIITIIWLLKIFGLVDLLNIHIGNR